MPPAFKPSPVFSPSAPANPAPAASTNPGQSPEDAQFQALLQKYNYTPPATAATTGGWYSKLGSSKTSGEEDAQGQDNGQPKTPISQDPIDQHPILKTLGNITGVTDLGKGLAQAIFLNLTPEGKKAQEDLQSGRITPDEFDNIVGGGLETNKAVIGSAMQTALTIGTAGLGGGEAAAAKEGATGTEAAIAAAKAATPGLGARILKAGATGAGMGAAGGAIDEFGKGGNVEDIAKSAGEGALTGTALGGASEVAATGLGKVAAAGKTMLEDAANRIDTATEKAAAPAAAVADTGGKKDINNLAASAIAQASATKSASIHDVYMNPDRYTQEKMDAASRESNADYVKEGINKKVNDLETGKLGAGVDLRTLADQVKAGLDKKDKEIQNSMEEYGPITGNRQPGKKFEGPSIKVDPNFLQKQIAKITGRTVSKGVIDSAPKVSSTLRSTKDVATLQKWFNDHNEAFKKGTLTGGEFLNIRKDLAGLANYDHGGAPSSDLETLGKSLYGSLNDTYRGRFSGLEQQDSKLEQQLSDQKRLRTGLLDNNGDLSENALTRILGSTDKNKFAIGDKLEEVVPGIKKQVQKLQDINAAQQKLRAGIVDEKGNLLDGAANKIHNAFGVGKGELSDRLEETAPGIGDRIKFMKVVEDLKSAADNKTAAYTRGALGGVGLATLNPMALAAWAVGHPKLLVPTLRKMGYAAGNAEKIAADLGIDEFAK